MKPFHLWRTLNLWLEKRSSLLSAWASVVALIGVPLILIGGYASWIQVRDYLIQPDIVLQLTTPKKVCFWLLNPSPVLLHKPQYQFGLWDLDARVEGTGNDPGNLLIPVKSLDYIRPKSAIGPWTIDGLSNTANSVPDGHVVFGWVSIQSPDCQSRRHYWLLFRKGESAWYSEITPDEQLLIMKNLSTVLEAGKAYTAEIDRIVPVGRRLRVQDGG